MTRFAVPPITIFQASYDFRTRRLTKTEGGSVSYYRYDGGDCFQELVGGSSTNNVEFVRGSGMGRGIGSILCSDRGGTNEFFTYNAVGHTVALTEAGGSVTKTDLYEAFGNIVSSSGSSPNNRLANTKERDASIGLDSLLGAARYVSADRSGFGVPA